jgi:hypothetical protein
VVGRCLCSSGLILWLATGCTSISVAPSCPSELRVGESGTLQANESNPGAIPTYKWEAVPSDAVAVESPAASATKIEALKAGEVLIRLTAGDSLFQVVSECRLVIIQAGNVTVSLVIDPNPIEVGESTVLFCASTGDVDAITRTLEQVEGPVAALDPLSEGVATITPEEPGELTFRCVGETEDGVASAPSEATVTIVTPSDASDNDNVNVNDNLNDNSGDNGTDNANDNDGRPSRGGRG